MSRNFAPVLALQQRNGRKDLREESRVLGAAGSRSYGPPCPTPRATPSAGLLWAVGCGCQLPAGNRTGCHCRQSCPWGPGVPVAWCLGPPLPSDGEGGPEVKWEGENRS